MWSIACYPSYTPEGGVPRARRIFRRYLPAEILTYLIINFLWAGLSLWLVSTLRGERASWSIVNRTTVFWSIYIVASLILAYLALELFLI